MRRSMPHGQILATSTQPTTYPQYQAQNLPNRSIGTRGVNSLHLHGSTEQDRQGPSGAIPHDPPGTATRSSTDLNSVLTDLDALRSQYRPGGLRRSVTMRLGHMGNSSNLSATNGNLGDLSTLPASTLTNATNLSPGPSNQDTMSLTASANPPFARRSTRSTYRPKTAGDAALPTSPTVKGGTTSPLSSSISTPSSSNLSSVSNPIPSAKGKILVNDASAMHDLVKQLYKRNRELRNQIALLGDSHKTQGQGEVSRQGETYLDADNPTLSSVTTTPSSSPLVSPHQSDVNDARIDKAVDALFQMKSTQAQKPLQVLPTSESSSASSSASSSLGDVPRSDDVRFVRAHLQYLLTRREREMNELRNELQVMAAKLRLAQISSASTSSPASASDALSTSITPNSSSSLRSPSPLLSRQALLSDAINDPHRRTSTLDASLSTTYDTLEQTIRSKIATRLSAAAAPEKVPKQALFIMTQLQDAVAREVAARHTERALLNDRILKLEVELSERFVALQLAEQRIATLTKQLHEKATREAANERRLFTLADRVRGLDRDKRMLMQKLNDMEKAAGKPSEEGGSPVANPEMSDPMAVHKHIDKT